MLETRHSCAGDDFPVPIESDAVVLADTSETLVASHVGAASACDVWLAVPADWLPRVTLRVYGRLGRARALLRQVPLGKVDVTTSGGLSSGVAISLRGRPCESFEVTAQASAGAALSNGRVYLQAWHGAADFGSSVGDDDTARTRSPSVAATLVGRDSATGAPKAVATDSDGRLLVSNPYFTSSDKTKVDGATSEATPDKLALRGASGEAAFGYVRLPDVATAPAAGSGEARVYFDDPDLVVRTSNGFLKLSFLGGSGIKLAAKDATLTLQPTDQLTSSTVGYAATFAAGKGNGASGGVTYLGADNGGTPGTHLAGDIVSQLGTLVGGSSAGHLFRMGSSDFLKIFMNGTYGLASIWTQSSMSLDIYSSGNAQMRAGNTGYVTAVSNLELVGSQVDLWGSAITVRDLSYNEYYRFPVAAAGGLTVTSICTSFDLAHTKRTGTGANVGSTLKIKAQDGQDVASGAPNGGGPLRLVSGAKGSGGTGTAADGAITLETGSTERVRVAGDGTLTQHNAAAQAFQNAAASLEHLRFELNATEGTVPSTPTRLALWQKDGQLYSLSSRIVRQEITCQDQVTSTATSKRVVDRMSRYTSTAIATATIPLIPLGDLPGGAAKWVARFTAQFSSYNTTNQAVAGGMLAGTSKRNGSTVTVVTTAANQKVGVLDTEASSGISTTSLPVIAIVGSDLALQITTTSTNDIRINARIQLFLVEH